MAHTVGYRGTNGFRLAMRYNKNLSADEPTSLRVGDENKGLLSYGISYTTDLGETNERYARQSVDYAQDLPPYRTLTQWQGMSSDQKSKCVADMNASTSFGEGGVVDLVLSMTIQHHSLEIGRRNGKIKNAEQVIERCDDFVSRILQNMTCEQYEEVRKYKDLAVIAEGTPKGKTTEFLGGMLTNEGRIEEFEVRKVYHVKTSNPGDDALWEDFVKAFPNYSCYEYKDTPKVASPAAAASAYAFSDQ